MNDPMQIHMEGVTKRAVVVFSGGQDSTTCLYQAIADGFEVHAITFDYGQRHSRELMAARKIASMAGAASHRLLKLGPVLEGTSPLVNPNTELAQYPDHHSLPGGLEATFVPMRNQLFFTLAANRAYVLGANHLYSGVCQEDSGGYPDCLRVFVDALENACNLGTFTAEAGFEFGLHIVTPLMFFTKAESVHCALALPGCYEALAFSHTGYDGAYPPTGHDHATLLRAKGFEEANVPDPLILRAYIEGYLNELPSTPNYAKERRVEYVERLLEVVTPSIAQTR